MGEKIIQPPFYNSGFYNTCAGGGYNGKFVYLNNFDNINSGASISDIGDSIPLDTSLFSIVSSSVFNNENCLVMDKNPANSHLFYSFVDFPEEYTIETYLSNYISSYNGTSTTEFTHRGSAIESLAVINSYRHQCLVLDDDIILYNGAELLNDLGTSKYIKIPIANSANAHYACVVKNGYSYIFVNGVLYIKYKNISDLMKIISFGREQYPVYMGINFICVRKGDFSNNLTSFTVPTSKYVFDG